MYDKDRLEEELTLDDIKTILVELGSQHIETHLDKGHLITNTICHNISDGKMKLYYYIEEKRFHCYTACAANFNVFDLVIKNHILKGIQLTFGDAVKWILNTLGKSDRTIKPNGFGNFGAGRLEELDWLDSLEVEKPVVVPMRVHSDYIFNLFSKKPHIEFLKDNISEESMKKFEIMYYEKTNRIVIPHRHWKTGEIIGIKSRSLNFEDIDKGYKYIPLRIQDIQYNFPNFQNLFGYYLNKETIKRIGKVIILESEKSVLQLESYFPGQNFSVAICGSNVSKLHANMLLELGVSEVIISLDKEFEKPNSNEAKIYKEKILRICKMFSSYVNVSMIWDRDGLTEYKSSPTDSGKETFIKLFKKRKIISTVD